MVIKMIRREHYEQLHAKKFDKLDEADRFNRSYHNFAHEHTENLNSPVSINESEFVMKTFPKT